MARAATGEAAGGIAGQFDTLRYHWGDAYRIGHDRHWWAERLDGKGDRITAASSYELMEEISADYTRNPVPREVCP
ncbi:MAG TPA: hypothetical protein VF070_13250 [Streptosporangiaceae bacterium]